MAPGAHPLPELTRCGVGKLVDLATRDKPSGFNWFSPECSRGRGERASAYRVFAGDQAPVTVASPTPYRQQTPGWKTHDC